MCLFRAGAAFAVACLAVPQMGAQTGRSARVPAAAGASAGVDVPALGFVVGAGAREVRPLWGHAGAPGAGPALPLPEDTTEVIVADSQDVALVGNGSGWSVLSLKTRTSRVLAAQTGQGSLARLSRSGSRAVLWDPEKKSLQVFGALSSAPSVEFSVATETLSMPVVAAAVSDDAEVVLFAASDGRSGSLYLARKGSAPREIAQTGHISALRFLQDGRKAIASDRLWNSLLAVDASGSGEVRVLAGAAAGLDAPADIALDERRGRIFVANAAGRNVMAVSLSGERLMSVSSAFAPERIAAVGGLLMVASAETGSVWTIRPDAPGAEFAFLPSID
jgi:hypothetical protein